MPLKTITQSCLKCGREFQGVPSAHRKYCSRECMYLGRPSSKRKTLICDACGQPFTVYQSQRQQPSKYCSKACASVGNRRPDRYVMSNGYVSVRDANGNRIDEHRHVMEQHLGRALRSDEHVHHVNRDTTDNRLENLRVMRNVDHSRLHTALNGRWSKSYDCCIDCGTSAVKHIAKGRCSTCHSKQYLERRRATAAFTCNTCGRDGQVHAAFGECKRCYDARRNRAKRTARLSQS